MKPNTDRSRLAYRDSYVMIRNMILNGDLALGTKVIEDRLARELGVSRTPIREAIRQLEQEGLIAAKMVVNPSERDLRNTFEVRILLESYSARCACSYLAQADLGILHDCVVMGKTGSNDEIMQANEKFHEVIVKSSKNPVMIDIIDRMQSIIYLFRRTVVEYKRPYLIEEHEQIYEAIGTGDADSAEFLMKKHLQTDLEFCLHLFADAQPE